MSRRRSGLLIPLFSLMSSRSWGVGEFLDLPRFARWAERANQSFVQILPILEVPDHATSPYAAPPARAPDPIFTAIEEVEDVPSIGGFAVFEKSDESALAARVPLADEMISNRANCTGETCLDKQDSVAKWKIGCHRTAGQPGAGCAPTPAWGFSRNVS